MMEIDNGRSFAMTILKLVAVGTSTGVIVPKEMLARMNVAKGDSLFVVEAPDGSYRLTAYDPSFAKKMEKADDIMRRYRNTLHVLAQ
jgi:putative addiction module antidote